MATGFSNEKSAEYVVLFDLYSKLKNKCTFFYPFLYQSKRDDTLLSLQNQVNDLRLVVCFVRRPKANYEDDDEIEITFRETLFDKSNFFYKEGVSSIIGVPIGSRIEEIGFGAKCQWFYPEKNAISHSTCIINKNSMEFLKLDKTVNALSEHEIIDLIKCATIWKWNEIILLLQTWYAKEKYNSFNRFGFWVRGQRPIFIAYKLDADS